MNPIDKNTAAIGIDVGGTDIKTGLVGADGLVLERRAIATQAAQGPARVLAHIVEAARGLQSRAAELNRRVVGVGVGLPGSIDRKNGAVVSPPNLPGWGTVRVAAPMSEALRLPVAIDNDANVALLGERWIGAGHGAEDEALITLGTGVGGAIILGGKLWRGRFGNAGEIGHTIVVADGRPCRCGQHGCLEAYASASNTAARAAEAIAAGRKSSLADISRPITAEDVHLAVRNGDALACEIWDETCRFLAMACVNLQHLLNLERIIFAGGMSAAGEQIVQPIRAHFERMMWPDQNDRPQLALAELGNEAGLVGGAWLALNCR